MPITEPHPAHHEPAQNAGEPPSADPPVQRRRRPWRRCVLQAAAARGSSPWPVIPAGPVGWMFEIQGLPHTGPVSGRSVAGVTLPPGQGVTLGIPLRLSYGGACYVTGGWVSLDTFYVKERFGPFTHWVTVQFPEPLSMREPESRGALPASTRVCLPGPAKPK